MVTRTKKENLSGLSLEELQQRLKELQESKSIVSATTYEICIGPAIDLTEKAIKKLLPKPPKVRVPRERRSAYARLRDFLSKMPPEQKQLALDLPEIEKVMGRQLPKTAFKNRNWWGNASTEKTKSTWVQAGWEVDQVYLAAQTVVFRRKGRNPLQEIPMYLQALLEGSRYRGRPDARTLIEWVGFCRRVGWYFEGTVLFEKGGLEVDSLAEAESVEVEEDYAICKRELLRYKNHELVTSARE